MKKEEIKVGGHYLAKVGSRSVEVRVEGETPKGGWNAVSVASGKPIRIKDPRHLRPAKEADAAAVPDPEVEQPAPADDADLVPLTQLDKEKKRGGKKAKAPKVPKAEKVPKEKSSKEKPSKEKSSATIFL
jgi:hypothetical protein